MTFTARNLVLVSYDSVRADVAFSGMLNALERLRRTGTSFTNCISSAPLTPVSHASIMTGLQPYAHGIRHLFKEKLRTGSKTLAHHLKAAGFVTSAVVSCPGLNRWYGIDAGFDRYDDEIPKLSDGTDPLTTVDVKKRGTALKRAPKVIERSLASIEGLGDKRFFHFIHFFDAHWPYAPPESAPGKRGDNPYEEEVRYLDHYFGIWLERMAEMGRLDDTLVVLFADHGEDLCGWYENDKGGPDGAYPEEMGHGCLLYEPTIHVPLIFSHPGLLRQEISCQVRLVDILPTCLELLDLDIPEKLHGVSLASSILTGSAPPPIPAYSETHYPREQVDSTGGQFEWTKNKKSIRFPQGYKVILQLDSDMVEAYDLNRDPNEVVNLLGEQSRSQDTARDINKSTNEDKRKC